MDNPNTGRRILVVDDDPDLVKILCKALQIEGYAVESAESGRAALEKMERWSPHLVLLDINMPEIDGLQTLKKLHNRDTYVSVIFVSGNTSSGDIIRGLDAGADDYICKPFDIKVLLSRVRCQLRIKDLNDELKRANVKLQELVDVDDLTGLFNMRSLYAKLDYELSRAARYSRRVCVLMLDMDFFKRVNDENDHLFGSYVLAEVGRMIKENIRVVDYGARYGGDEFLVVLTEIDTRGAISFSERLRKLVEETTFKYDDHRAKITVSIGFAISGVGDKLVDAKSLVRFADQALYESKKSGRNRVTYKDLAERSTFQAVKSS